MILPTKGIPSRQALVTRGGGVIRSLHEPKTVSHLWEELHSGKDFDQGITFDWFVLTLDFLFLIGAIELDRGRIRRAEPISKAAGA